MGTSCEVKVQGFQLTQFNSFAIPTNLYGFPNKSEHQPHNELSLYSLSLSQFLNTQEGYSGTQAQSLWLGVPKRC